MDKWVRCGEGAYTFAGRRAPTPAAQRTPDGGRRTAIDVPDGSVRVNPDEPAASEHGGAAVLGIPILISKWSDGVCALDQAREHLAGFMDAVRDKGLPELRTWRRTLRRLPDPLPEEFVNNGAAIARDLLQHATAALDRITAAFGGIRPAWAGPLHGIAQQIGDWVTLICAPGTDVQNATLEGLEFLASVPYSINELNNRLSIEVQERREVRLKAQQTTAPPPTESPSVPKTNKKKRGRPRIDPKKYAIAFEVERYYQTFGGTWEEACCAVGRVRGQRVNYNTIKSYLRKARLRNIEAQTQSA